MLFRHFLLIIFLFSLLSQSKSQVYTDSPYSARQSFGIYAGAGLNLHFADYGQLPGIDDCCQQWGNGSGLNINTGLFYSLPLGEKLELMLGAKYSILNGSFSEDENRFMPLVNASNGTVDETQGTFVYEQDASISSIAGNLGLTFRLTNQFRIGAGLRAGMLQSASTVTERLTEPRGLVYQNPDGTPGTRTRNLLDNEELEGASTLDLAIETFVSYDLPISSSYEWFLVPMVGFNYGISPVNENLDWSISTLNGGIGIRYAPRDEMPPAKPFTPPPPPPPPPLPAPPPPPVVPNLDAQIIAVSVDENGNESSISTIKVEENYQIRTHPLLNFVFFDEGSPLIPEKYEEVTEAEKLSYSFKELIDVNTMGVYYNILNIVGKRMEFYPQATLTLIGCHSDEAKEESTLNLSRDRAQAVKNYLTQDWGIDASRIRTQSRDLPSLPSNIDTDDGDEENRRVEMIANLPQIFEPMIIKDTIRTSNPPYIRFKPVVNAEVGVKSWKIITSQDGVDLKTFEGAGDVPKEINWLAYQEDEQEFIPVLERPLGYRMEVIDNDGKQWTSKIQTLPVEQLTIKNKIFEGIEDKIFNKFSMIGFPFNSAEIEGRNKSMLDNAMRAIEEDSEVFVYGYSDRIGEEDLNLRLSKRRADAVGKALNLKASNIKAFGESRLLYDNSTPEGRFYSRTVVIDVITTIE
ncbi:MAG: hypothetical protein Kapaf2KO_14210 [Candidatus Kapaibacteriales bacterium]